MVLAARGFSVFYDEDDLHTITLDVLKEEIRASAAFVIFVDEKTFDSEWCRAEIKFAADADVPIFTVIDRDRYHHEHWRTSEAEHGVDRKNIIDMWYPKLEKIKAGTWEASAGHCFGAGSHHVIWYENSKHGHEAAQAKIEAALRKASGDAGPTNNAAAVPKAAMDSVSLPWVTHPLPARISTKDGERVRQLMRAMVRGPIHEYYPNVLLSYATGHRRGHDAPGTGPGMFYALWIALLLKQRGIDCFSGLCVGGGEDWKIFLEKLGGRFARCECLIVVQTDALYHSRPCLQELHTAVVRRAKILPVLLEQCRLMFKADKQWPDIKPGDEEPKKWLFEVQRIFGNINSVPAPPATALDRPEPLLEALDALGAAAPAKPPQPPAAAEAMQPTSPQGDDMMAGAGPILGAGPDYSTRAEGSDCGSSSTDSDYGSSSTDTEEKDPDALDALGAAASAQPPHTGAGVVAEAGAAEAAAAEHKPHTGAGVVAAVEEVAAMLPENMTTTRTAEFEELVRSVHRAGEVQARLESHTPGGQQLTTKLDAAIRMLEGGSEGMDVSLLNSERLKGKGCCITM